MGAHPKGRSAVRRITSEQTIKIDMCVPHRWVRSHRTSDELRLSHVVRIVFGRIAHRGGLTDVSHAHRTGRGQARAAAPTAQVKKVSAHGCLRASRLPRRGVLGDDGLPSGAVLSCNNATSPAQSRAVPPPGPDLARA
jgi:hypothetical protein